MDQAHRVVSSFVVLLAICAGIGVAIPRVWKVEPSAARSEPRAKLRDLSGAGFVEILDASRRSVLRGELRDLSTAPGDLLKAAQLVGGEGDAVGKAELEVVRQPNGALVQELEIDVDGLPGDAVFSVYVDGEPAGAFRTDPNGGAELERYGRVGVAVRSGD